MVKKIKYYVVWEGNNPGIYDSWADAQLQIKGFPNAKYKAFKSKEEAIAAYRGLYYDHVNKGTSKKKKPISTIHIEDNPDIIKDSIAVDAACSGNPGKMEYRGVNTFSKDQLFHVGPLDGGTNNIGEFLALVHALARFQKLGNSTTTIYTDSRTAQVWVRKKFAKTTLKPNGRNQIIFDLIRRAQKWLNTHEHRNPIVKWNTEEWGEIPADFGRK